MPAAQESVAGQVAMISLSSFMTYRQSLLTNTTLYREIRVRSKEGKDQESIQ